MLPVCRCSLSALTTGKAMETELKASQHPLDKFAYCPVCGCRRFDVATVKSKRCADCGFELFMNPSASVAVFIRNGEGELLFVVRGCEPAKGTLDLPGGFTDIGETVEEAVRREVMEETGHDGFVLRMPRRRPDRTSCQRRCRCLPVAETVGSEGLRDRPGQHPARNDALCGRTALNSERALRTVRTTSAPHNDCCKRQAEVLLPTVAAFFVPENDCRVLFL